MLKSALTLGEHLWVSQRHFCTQVLFRKKKGGEEQFCMEMHPTEIHCTWLDHKPDAKLFSSSALMHRGWAWGITWKTHFIQSVLSAFCQANRFISLYKSRVFSPTFFMLLHSVRGKKKNQTTQRLALWHRTDLAAQRNILRKCFLQIWCFPSEHWEE